MYEGLTDKGMKIWQFLEKGIRQGLSFNQIINKARELGISYRRKDMLHDLRVISKAIENFDYIKRMPKHRVVNEDVAIKTKFPTPKRFMVTFEVKLLNTETGEEVTKYFTVGSDYKQPLNYFESSLYDSFNAPEFVDTYKFEITEATPVKIFGWW